MSTKLFSAIRLGQVDLDNRIVVSPMCQYSANDGCASDWHSTHLGMLANSGAALVVIEMTDIERHGRITHGCLGLYSDDCEAALGRVVAHCRHIGTARLGIQIAHAGRKGSAHPPWEGGGPLGPDEDPWETIAPSPLPFGPKWPVPREMAEADFARVREAFVQAVRRAVRIGFDTIELHMAHGYLLHSFLSPVANQRRDQYGGSLEGRIRFPLQVARAVREVVPSGRALGARITGSDWHADGIAIDDAVAFATALKEAGFDYLDVSSGGITAETRNPTQPGYNAPLAQRVRDQVKLPTRTVGLISTPQQADALVSKGQADMVALGRAMLDNPHWGWHAARMLGAEVKRPKQYQRAGPKLWSPAVALD